MNNKIIFKGLYFYFHREVYRNPETQTNHRTKHSICCIRCGPDEERILDVVPRGTELGTQAKTGSRAGNTHTQQSPGRVHWSFIVRK